MNDMSYFNIYKSIRAAARDTNVDFSCLAKQLKNNKYKSVGGGNPGRKKKNDDTLMLDGFSIFINGEIPISDLIISYKKDLPEWIAIDLNGNSIIDENERESERVMELLERE